MNRLISFLRAAWYWLYEPARLRLARVGHVLDEESRPVIFARALPGYPGPKVSVYIPTFNRADLLMERGLKSVVAQTYKNLEIIVVSHGCTDDTVDRVQALGDHRIKVIEVPRRVQYLASIENHWFAHNVDAANAGLKACTGEWIARNDDDDIWAPNHVEWLLQRAQMMGAELVSGAYLTHETTVYDDGETPPMGGHQTWLYRSYLKFMRYNPDCWRKRWNKVNDTDLADRIRKAGVRTAITRQVVTEILPRPGETEIGLKAYKADEEAKMEKYG